METMAELGCWPPSSSIENKSSGTEHMFVRARTCKWKQIRLNLEWKTSKCSSRIPLQFDRGSLFIPTLWWWCIANFRCIWEAVKYTMDAQVRYLLSSCQSAVCHRTFYVTELFIGHLFNLFPQYDSHNFCPPLLPGTFFSSCKEECANAKDLCNKHLDKSVRLCIHFFSTECDGRCISPEY